MQIEGKNFSPLHFGLASRPSPAVFLAATERGQLISHHRVAVVEQLQPSGVAHLGYGLGGAYHVGEHYGGEGSVRVRTMAHAGNKFFDLVQKKVQQIGSEGLDCR